MVRGDLDTCGCKLECHFRGICGVKIGMCAVIHVLERHVGL